MCQKFSMIDDDIKMNQICTQYSNGHLNGINSHSLDKGQVASPKWMNFRKSFNRPLNPLPPFFMLCLRSSDLHHEFGIENYPPPPRWLFFPKIQPFTRPTSVSEALQNLNLPSILFNRDIIYEIVGWLILMHEM